MSSRKGHVSAIWLSSNAAASQRLQNASRTDEDDLIETGFGDRYGNPESVRVTWEELVDARQAVASVAHVWDEERNRDKALCRRWPWRLLTMEQVKSAAFERLRRKRVHDEDPLVPHDVSTAVAAADTDEHRQGQTGHISKRTRSTTRRRHDLSNYKADPVSDHQAPIGNKSASAANCNKSIGSGSQHSADNDEEFVEPKVSKGSSTPDGTASSGVHSGDVKDSDESAVLSEDDVSSGSEHSDRPPMPRVVTRAFLGLRPLPGSPPQPEWRCSAGVRTDADDMLAGYTDCGHINSGSDACCTACGAAKAYGSGGQLHQRTLAALQTSDIGRAGSEEIAERMEAAAGSDPHEGLHFVTQDVDREMQAQLKKMTEHEGGSERIYVGDSQNSSETPSTPHTGRHEGVAGNLMPTELYLASLMKEPMHSSKRLTSAVLQLHVSFLRLAEYQATVVATEVAGGDGGGGATNSALSIFSGDQAIREEAEIETERKQQEQVVKAAQRSSNFAMQLIESLISEAAAPKQRRRVSRHLAPRRDISGVKPATTCHPAAAGVSTTAEHATAHDAASESASSTGGGYSPSAARVSGKKDGYAEPIAARRMLPLQSLEAIFASLPHYPNPEDLAEQAADDTSNSAQQTTQSERAASARLLGSRAAAVSSSPTQSSVYLPLSMPPSQSQSAFEQVAHDSPSTLPTAAGAQPARHRFTAPQGLIFHGRGVYVDAPTIVKGRLRHDRVGKFRPPASLEVASVTQRRHETLDLVPAVTAAAPEVQAVFGSAAETGLPPAVLSSVLKSFLELPRH